MAIKNFNSQFAHPQGWVGRLVGTILAWKNRERNAWTISMLDIQPDDQVLEIGFGPGQAIQEVRRVLKPSGWVVITIQPMWAKTEQEVQSVSEKLILQLKQAGFRQVRLETRQIKPITDVSGIGIK